MKPLWIRALLTSLTLLLPFLSGPVVSCEGAAWLPNHCAGRVQLTASPAVDPGNYATDIAAGASYRFRLLFVILVSNLIAIFLQNLAIKLGTVTGLNLAEACRAFLPRWLNYFLYFMAEAAIIATDIAEVGRPGVGSPGTRRLIYNTRLSAQPLRLTS